METTANLAAYIRDSNVIGPGLRDAIYLQGCSIRCPGCANSGMQEHNPRHIVPVSKLLRLLSGRRDSIDGITLLGGEPTEQAGASAAILEGAQKLGLSTVLFTGRLIEDLQRQNDRDIDRMLHAADLLIDGPYREDERDLSLHWRGSRNQRLIYLTDRFRKGCNNAAQAQGEIIVCSNRIIYHGVGTMAVLPCSGD